MLLPDAADALTVAERAIAATIAIASLERVWAVIAVPTLTDWVVVRTRNRRMAAGVSGAAFALLFGSTRRTVATLLLRAVLAVVLVLPLSDAGRALVVPAVFLLSLMLHAGPGFGADGADQLATIAVATLVLFHWLNWVPGVAEACASFLVLQLALAYFTAGIAKVISPVWRSGSALSGILATSSWGSPRVAGWLRERPAVARLGAWAVMAFECVFPMVLVLPPTPSLALLLCGLVFHAGVAVLMGLNTFVLAFCGLYPCVLWWCS